MLLNSKVCERKVKIVHKLLWYHWTGDFCELYASVSTFNINYTAITIQICYRKLKKSKQMMKTFAELTYMDMLHRSKSSTSKTRRLRDDLLETFKISQGVKIIRIFPCNLPVDTLRYPDVTHYSTVQAYWNVDHCHLMRTRPTEMVWLKNNRTMGRHDRRRDSLGLGTSFRSVTATAASAPADHAYNRCLLPT